MQYTSSILFAVLSITHVLAHGVITEIQGANGVNMPGLSVADGTPRDCPSPACGAEADTSIIRANTGPLGKTQGSGPVVAATMLAAFMDGASGNQTDVKMAREIHLAARRLGSGSKSGAGTKTPAGTVETGVKAATGQGATSGLPTCSDSGVVTMTFHQVNQDGAGPLTASVDPTSGGIDASAFEKAAVTTNVPGIGIGGLRSPDYGFSCRYPNASRHDLLRYIWGATNVCVAKLQNSALAGPFGGSVAFTQSPAAKKRAIEYNLSKRRFARALADLSKE